MADETRPAPAAHELAAVELEQALLGQCFQDPKNIDIAAGLLEAEQFYEPLHQRIFDYILALHDEGGCSPPLVFSLMRTDAGLLELGGFQYLASLALSAPAGPVRDVCRRIRDLAIRRSLRDIGTQIAAVASDEAPGVTTSQQVAHAVRMIDQIAGSATNRVSQRTANAVGREIMEDVERAASGKRPPAATTGLSGLDDATGGLQGGDLCIVAGRSGMGKSSLLGGMALRAAMSGAPVLVFSLEMKATQWMARTITDFDFDTAAEPMHYSSFRRGTLKRSEADRAAQAAYEIGALPMEICDDDQLTIHQIASRARAFKAEHAGLGLIVLDYLQIVPADDPRASREQVVAHNARGAKAMAKMLDWPVVCGAQLLTKTSEMTGDKIVRPTLAHIRESGSIEFEADIVLAPFREAFTLLQKRPKSLQPGSPWQQEFEQCKNNFELHGLKNRHGAPFALDLFCDMAASAIRDHAPYRPDDGAAQLALEVS